MKLKLILLVGMVLGGFSTSVMAQNLTLSESNWKLLKSEENVEVYYQPSNCGSNDVIFLKVINNKNSQVTIDWSVGENYKTIIVL